VLGATKGMIMKINALPDEQEDLARFEGEGGHAVAELNPVSGRKHGAIAGLQRRLHRDELARYGNGPQTWIRTPTQKPK
jgi:hypothetical protein